MTDKPKVVGIDVSEARLDVCVLSEGAASSQANDEAGIVSLVEALKQLRPDLVVMEATGATRRKPRWRSRLLASGWRWSTCGRCATGHRPGERAHDARRPAGTG